MFDLTVLPNGVRVISEYIPYVRSISLGFWVNAGCRHEPAALSGASHLIEHMVFKGTPSRSARHIAEIIDSAGGQLNAYTSKEHTCFHARLLDRHLDLAADVLVDMLLESDFCPSELEKEKSVVLEEISMYEDAPDEVVHDLFATAALIDHPLAGNVLGTAEKVTAMSRADLVTYQKSLYTPGNLVVAAVGNVPHAQVVAAVTERLSSLSGPVPLQVRQPAPKVRRCLVKEKDTEQVHLCLGGLCIDRTSPAKYALHILDMALGGGMSSRLFQELREERGLVYATYSYTCLFTDNGLFAVYAGVSPRNVSAVLDIIRQQFADIARHGISTEELQRAKEQLKGSFMLGLESTTNRMSKLAKAELFQEEQLSPDQLIEHIDAVTAADVHEMAAGLLSPEFRVIAAVGPVTDSVLEDE